MHRALPVLDELKIASPCSASWADMVGDERRRFCGSCEKNVYDLTVMTPVEIVDLIERTEGKFCGRLYQRRDGRVLTDDCPVGVRRLVAKAKRKTYRLAALAVMASASILSMLAYRDSPLLTKTIEKIEEHTPPDPDVQPVAGGLVVDPMIMGDIAPPPPQ